MCFSGSVHWHAIYIYIIYKWIFNHIFCTFHPTGPKFDKERLHNNLLNGNEFNEFWWSVCNASRQGVNAFFLAHQALNFFVDFPTIQWGIRTGQYAWKLQFCEYRRSGSSTMQSRINEFSPHFLHHPPPSQFGQSSAQVSSAIIYWTILSFMKIPAVKSILYIIDLVVFSAFFICVE